jgi:predicted transcriptional regulator
VPQADLVALITRTHTAPAGLGKEAELPPPAEKPVPTVPIRKSVTPDAIICLADGKASKSLRRHLRSSYGMSPGDDRTKWGVPHDYPTVAPNYAEARSALAKSMGLGQKRRKTPARGRQAG